MGATFSSWERDAIEHVLGLLPPPIGYCGADISGDIWRELNGQNERSVGLYGRCRSFGNKANKRHRQAWRARCDDRPQELPVIVARYLVDVVDYLRHRAGNCLDCLIGDDSPGIDRVPVNAPQT